jgi:hypothetical protein
MPLQIILVKKFRDDMYKNMWSYMNPDMMKHIFKQLNKNLKITYKDDIEDDDFTKKFANSICFKGDEDEGHYVYVDKDKTAYGSYENDLLTRETDDGICHGVALIFALGENDENKKFPLVIKPNKSRDDNKNNYISILSLYKWLIEEGYWDKALKDNFYNDVDWIENEKTTKQSQKSLEILNAYINRLKSS